MADYIHMANVIQGEVLRIKERMPLEKRYDALTVLENFLRNQAQQVLLEKIRVKDMLPPPDSETASQSAVEEHAGQ